MAKPDSAVQDLDKLHNQSKSSKAMLEPIWIMNHAYYNDRQWLGWNGRQLFEPSLRPDRITIVDNRIQPAVRKEIARMTKTRPVFTVVPTSADDDNVSAAELGEHVMRFMWRHLRAKQVTIKALRWSRICSAGFVKVFWDSTLGDATEVLVAAQTNRVLQDAQGAPLRPGTIQPGMLEALGLGSDAVRTRKVAPGDVVLEARSPFQMFPDPLADTFDECEWVIEESVKSKEYVKRRFDVELAPDTPANPGMIEAKLATATPGQSPYKGIKLREMWAKPSSDYPGGRRVVWAQNKILEEDRQPFDALPYVMFSGIAVPGRLWPMAIVETLRGPQTELNKLKSQLAENRNRVGNPTLWASKQAIQDPEEFANSISTPGGIAWTDVTYGPDSIPKYLEAPALPQYVIDQIPMTQESIQEISGQHDVTSAQVPPGVTAASAINLLQEADDTMIAPDIEDYEEGLGKLGEKVLRLVAHYYTDQRTIQIAGDNGAWQIFPFKGEMLKGNTHVQVQAGSAMPQSRAARQAGLTDIIHMLAQMGHQFDARELAQFLQDYDLGGAEKLIDQYTKNETQINWENLQLGQGARLSINDYDDDEAHIAGHTDFQKAPRYMKLPPEIRQTCEEHVNAHRQRAQQAQQQQLQNEMLLAGKLPPNLTEAAFQQEQQLSQMQGLQQMLQGQQDQQGTAQQQGFDQASAEQQQRQQAEQHQLQMQQLMAQQQRELELHHQKMGHAEEQHQARLQQQKQQAQQSQQQRKAA